MPILERVNNLNGEFTMNFTKYNVSVDKSLSYDAGLRAYMLQVFNFMGIALMITGVTAYYASSESFMAIMYSKTASGISLSPIGWVIQLAPLGMVLFLSYKIQKLSVQNAKIAFWAYSIIMGLALGPIFYSYTGESIARTFFISASVFGSMSLYGYSTKKDLTAWGSFLMMGLIGVIIASVVNIFLQSSAVSFATSLIGVIVFTGLTAYDVQKIKSMYAYATRLNGDDSTKLAIRSALTLYLDFINLFIMLLQFFGNRR
jgi:uncharacterized protein